MVRFAFAAIAVFIAAVIACYFVGCMLIDALCDMLKPPRW